MLTHLPFFGHVVLIFVFAKSCFSLNSFWIHKLVKSRVVVILVDLSNYKNVNQFNLHFFF